MTAPHLSLVSETSPSMNERTAYAALLGGARLSAGEAGALMAAVVGGHLSDPQIAAVLGALSARRPTAAEIAGFSGALADAMVPLPGAPDDAIDTCGTGGSGRPTPNTSTLAGVVAAAAGATVVKHGNRSASGRSGSLDVLEALGAEIQLSPAANARVLKQCRFAFLDARAHHPALGRLAPIRKALGVRTVFNLLGPLLNPARVRRQVLGVSDRALAPVLAEALAARGAERAWVVVGDDGLDELPLDGPGAIYAVQRGQVRRFAFDPRPLGLSAGPLGGGDVAENARLFTEALDGAPSPARDHAALNAAAALVVAGIASDLEDGLRRALAVLADGGARACFQAWRQATLSEAAGARS